MAHTQYNWVDPGLPPYAQFVPGQPLKHGLALSAAMAEAPWAAVALHRLLSITGFVHLRLAIMVTTEVDSAAEGFVFHGVGIAGNTNLYYTNADAEAVLVEGAILNKGGAPTQYLTPTSDSIWEGVVGHDIFYEIKTEIATSGQMLFIAHWAPVTPDGLVVIANGAAS